MTKKLRSYSIISVIKNYRTFLSQKRLINYPKALFSRLYGGFKQAENSFSFPWKV